MRSVRSRALRALLTALLLVAALSVVACGSTNDDDDSSSSSSVRMLAMIVLSTTPMVSMTCSRKLWLTTVKGRSEASSMTPRTWSSKSTGSTTMLTGDASPSPELTLM